MMHVDGAGVDEQLWVERPQRRRPAGWIEPGDYRGGCRWTASGEDGGGRRVTVRFLIAQSERQRSNLRAHAGVVEAASLEGYRYHSMIMNTVLIAARRWNETSTNSFP